MYERNQTINPIYSLNAINAVFDFLLSNKRFSIEYRKKYSEKHNIFLLLPQIIENA